MRGEGVALLDTATIFDHDDHHARVQVTGIGERPAAGALGPGQLRHPRRWRGTVPSWRACAWAEVRAPPRPRIESGRPTGDGRSRRSGGGAHRRGVPGATAAPGIRKPRERSLDSESIDLPPCRESALSPRSNPGRRPSRPAHTQVHTPPPPDLRGVRPMAVFSAPPPRGGGPGGRHRAALHRRLRRRRRGRRRRAGHADRRRVRPVRLREALPGVQGRPPRRQDRRAGHRRQPRRVLPQAHPVARRRQGRR